MSREVRRVPLDFAAPLNEEWEGYVRPDRFDEIKCTTCDGSGSSPDGRYMQDLWYGNAPFRPEWNSSTPFGPDHPAVRAFAERNVTRAPEYYGTGEHAIAREARRLATLFDGRWMHHLNADDVAALIAAGRLMDFTHTWDPENRWQPKDPPFVPTPEQVNVWSIGSRGHDSINAWTCIKARAKREGVTLGCSACDGHGGHEAYPGQRAEAEAWERTDPPTGKGWQLWTTVTAGSPISPVFATPIGLETWMVENGEASSRDVAHRFIKAGWCPTGGTLDGQHFTGVELVAELSHRKEN